MKTKCFSVEALSTDRNKEPLSVKVESALNDFLSSSKVDYVSHTVNTELQSSGFGRALIVIFYKEEKQNKK